jgi:hypothetical protein
MLVKLDVTLTDKEADDYLDDPFDFDDKSARAKLVNAVLEGVGLADANGGWTVKVAVPKSGGVKITGTLVPTGAVVLG